MTKYIEKSALVSEIRKMRSTTIDEYGNFYTAKARAEYNILCYLENLIDTIETKEVGSTDAFIKKATSYIQQHWIWNTKMIEDFKNYMKGCSPKNAVVIEGVCSDKDFIDTKHGILAFGAEEGSYRPFNDGDKVKIIIIRKE